MNQPEYLSKDILDEDFISTFKLFHYVQTVFGSCRVDVRNKFVTPPSIYQKIYSILLTVVAWPLIIYNEYVYIEELRHIPKMYYSYIVAIWMQFIANSCCIINARFLNGDANAQFYVKMQELDRLMKIDKSKEINGILRRINKFTIATLLSILLVFLASPLFISSSKFSGLIASIFGVLAYITDLSFCSNIILFFFIRIRFVNSIIVNHLKGNVMKYSRKFSHPTNKYMRMLAAETHDFIWSDTDVYLREIFKCVTCFQNIYKFQILVFYSMFLFWAVFLFQFGLLGIQYYRFSAAEYTIYFGFLGINLAIAVFISIRCDRFNTEVGKTKKLCAAVMARHYEGRLREKSKRMLKTITEIPPRFSIYDIWYLDARTLLHMFSVLTSLFVILLQFTFL